MTTTKQVLSALIKQESDLEIKAILENINAQIDQITPNLGIESKLNLIKAIIADSNLQGSPHSKTLMYAWNSDFIKYVTNAKRSSYEIDETQFKTQYKFSSPEEKAIFTRFAGNKSHHKTNKYMLHLITTKKMQYKTPDNKYLINIDNPHIKERFDEITNFEFCVVDKDFLERNELSKTTNVGKRYLYYVSKEDFDMSTKESWKVHTQSKVHPGYTVFKSYEALVEYFEEKVSMKAIYILSEYAANALRYMIDSIDFIFDFNVRGDDTYETFDIDKWTKFLGFNKKTSDNYKLSTKEIKQVKAQQGEFSAIRINGEFYIEKEVTNKYKYNLVTYTKAAGKALLYRPMKRKGVIEDVRYILIGGYKITTDSKLSKIENVESIDVDEYVNTTKDIYAGKITSLSVKPEIYEKYQVAFDEMSEHLVIQRLTSTQQTS